jgi:arylsulfatase A-like enzyme
MSDNGHHRDTGAKKFLRGNKWWLWEGGIRVPMIVRGPDIKTGSRCDVNVVGYDFLPTFFELAGGEVGKLRDVDGVSIKSLFQGKKNPVLAKRYLHFHYPHHRNTAPHSVVLQGDLKYFRFYEQSGSHYLYNLKYAIGETENIAAQNKAAVARLGKEMDRYHAAVEACLPKPNPDADSGYKPFDPDKVWE